MTTIVRVIHNKKEKKIYYLLVISKSWAKRKICNDRDSIVIVEI
jgi:hypothetical protein